VLERRLNEAPGAHPRFETLNFAVPGYNTAIEAAVLERRALAYEPDLVVIQFVNNDFGVPRFMQAGPAGPTGGRSLFLDFLAGRLRALRGGAAGADEDGLRDTEGEDRRKVLDTYRHMVGKEGYRRAMDRLASLTSPRGIPVIVLMGSATGEQARVVDRAAKKHGFRLVRVAPYTDAWVRARGIPDTREARRRALWVSDTDPHPNAEGHAIYAEALLDAIRSLDLGGRRAGGGV
jgi:lysophospholipase L1-like esterase